MALLRDEDKTAIQERLAEMTGNVTMHFFGSDENCEMCGDTKSLLSEVSELHEKLAFEEHNLQTDSDLATSYGIDKAPGTVLIGEDGVDRSIRYYGIPSGYEFASLLEDILMISAGDSGLDAKTREALAALEQDVHMQVFVTPTCPYCPGAVRVAHQMAFESDRVKADMVEAQEFMELSQKYHVMGVPRTIINDSHAVEGMMPEDQVLQEVLKAV